LPQATTARYEDLFDLPEHLVSQIINGRLVTHPRPAPKHARAYSSLGEELMGPYDKGRNGPGGWWILDAPEIHLAGDILFPDLAGARRERMPQLPETAWFDLAPDWGCEILSPATARIDRTDKMPVYASWGVTHLRLVDTDLRTLEVYVNRDGLWLLLAKLSENADVCPPPFDAITFGLAALWA
ncbi:MAG: Uma2 family endonuclease, partial [Thiobacillaceae bacterium]